MEHSGSLDSQPKHRREGQSQRSGYHSRSCGRTAVIVVVRSKRLCDGLDNATAQPGQCELTSGRMRWERAWTPVLLGRWGAGALGAGC